MKKKLTRIVYYLVTLSIVAIIVIAFLPSSEGGVFGASHIGLELFGGL